MPSAVPPPFCMPDDDEKQRVNYENQNASRDDRPQAPKSTPKTTQVEPPRH